MSEIHVVLINGLKTISNFDGIAIEGVENTLTFNSSVQRIHEGVLMIQDDDTGDTIGIPLSNIALYRINPDTDS